MAYDPTKAKGQKTSDIDSSVLGLPFLNVIQKGSPEFDETHAKHALKRVDGCKPGSIVFAPEKLVLTQPLLVIPVAQAQLYTEWKPRNAGGGFVGNRDVTVTTERNYRRGTGDKENKEFLGENELVFTIYVMVLFKQGDAWKKGVVSFTGTQLKHGRNWLKEVKKVKFKDLPDVDAPIFSAVYQLSTQPESNSKGSWFGWKVQLDHVLDLEKNQVLLEMAETASVEAVQSMPKLGNTDAPAQLTEGNDDKNPY